MRAAKSNNGGASRSAVVFMNEQIKFYASTGKVTSIVVKDDLDAVSAFLIIIVPPF